METLGNPPPIIKFYVVIIFPEDSKKVKIFESLEVCDGGGVTLGLFSIASLRVSIDLSRTFAAGNKIKQFYDLLVEDSLQREDVENMSRHHNIYKIHCAQ